ncbi:isocitrate/isopropylmalate dehydrogenase family protein [Brachybacterium rhamnosum]|uniref:Isocitrate/isopropylmalate dehydrogenase family protein n=1 Tax=Brachybacterium rhamnosum TaxID=173361 RepID=A0ABW4PV36_9MICO
MTTTYRLGLLLGDGIGPEIVPVAARALDAGLRAAGAPAVDWIELPLGREAIDTHGRPVPEETLETLKDVDGWLLGPHDSVSYPAPFNAGLNPSGTIRKHFDLFANIRPAKAIAGSSSLNQATDLVIVRENTEGFYADRNTFAGTGEMMPTPDVAIMHGIITRAATERIAHEAFRLAMTRDKHVTIVHKANVLQLTTGLFRDVCREIAAQYPEVRLDDFHIDAATVHLLRRAQEFDVIVTENMFGDILSDLTGEIAGSLGIAPSINSSDQHAMAQASHGSAPDIAGQGKANPIAMILSSTMLLRWLAGKHDDPTLLQAADFVDDAVNRTVAAGTVTPDMGGTATTTSFGDAVVSALDPS